MGKRNSTVKLASTAVWCRFMMSTNKLSVSNTVTFLRSCIYFSHNKQNWETKSAAIKANAGDPEGQLIFREVHYFRNRIKCPFGPVLSVQAFGPLLRQVQGGRLSFSPKAALALQLTIEMLMITTLSKAAKAARKRLEDKVEERMNGTGADEEEEDNDEDADEDEDDDDDKPGDEILAYLCAADVKESHDAVLQALSALSSIQE